MAKQLNVKLGFQADTSQAKAQIDALNQSLQKIATSIPNLKNKFDTSAIRDASNAAMELQQHLQKATDVNTGKLNLATFQASLKASNKDLNQLKKDLEKIGPEGQDAFMQVSQAIAYAENPIKRANKALDNFKTTLMNTARWQISSSILHGFMGAIQQAYGYAQDLNQSLNNIRIVTGYSTDEMAAFATQANKAAQALSTTTTSYTDAALIYYQQGIRDQAQIAARTDATIKLANVSRQSAEEVSQQMTAIWNNFDDGTKSLEYYADAITALGATTASSSEEIATGLEKFAAVSKTVGLSYEYATAALATITAQTRQSADTVGTGLRTLFARLESLKLGESLEDGVDLNKYSKALHDVGVEVLDTSGQMRNMDNILDDLATRWADLGQAQKMALAQTVGGVRQYTNLIALMDNWDKMQQNVITAQESEGTLSQQAEIYAESWEAAQKRVKAALEEIYGKLIDDDFFISLNDALATTINIVSGVIDSFGGLKGVLMAIAGIFMQSYAKEVPRILERLKEDILITTNKAQQAAAQLQTKNAKNLTNEAKNAYQGATDGTENYSMAYAAEAQAIATIAKRKQELNANSAKYSKDELTRANNEIARLEAQKQRLVAMGKKYDDLTDKTRSLKQELSGKVDDNILDKIEETGRKKGVFDSLIEGTNSLKQGLDNGTVSADSAQQKLLAMGDALNMVDPEAYDNLPDSMQKLQSGADLTTNEITELNDAISNVVVNTGQANHPTQQYREALAQVSEESEAVQTKCREMGGAAQGAGQAFVSAASGIKHFDDQSKPLANHMTTTSEQIVTFAGTLMTLTAAMNSMKRLGDVFSDEDSSAVDKASAAIGALVSVIMVLQGLKKIQVALNNAEVGSLGAVIAKWITEASTKGAATVAQEGLNAAMYSCPLVWIIGLVVAATAAVAGLAYGIYKLITAESKEAKAAKEAAAQAKRLGEAAEEANNRLKDIKDTVDGYTSAIEKLEQCTKGTEAWDEALANVYQKIDELLKKYPELLSYGNLFNADGTLNTQVLNEFLQKAADSAAAATAASYRATAKAQQAQVTAETKRINDKYMDEQETGETDEEGRKITENINTGHIDKSLATVQIDLDKLMSSYKMIGSSSLELGDVYQSVGNVTQEYANTLVDLANKQIQAQTAMSNATKLTIDKWARDNGQELVDGQNALMSVEYDKLYEDFSKAVKETSNTMAQTATADTSHLGAIFNGTSLEGLSITEAYNKARGKNESTARNAVRGSKGNRTYAYLDENGQEVEYKLEDMQAKIAAYAALEKMGKAAEEASAKVSQMNTGVAKFIGSGSLENLSRKEYNSIRNSFDEEGITQQTAYDYLLQQTGSEELAKKLTDDFVKQISAGWNNIFDKLPKDLSEKITEGMTIASATSLTKTLSKLNFGPLGEEAGAEFSKGLNDMLAGMDETDQQNALNQLANIDWSSWDAMEQANTILQSFGHELDLTDPRWKTFTDYMHKATVAQPDFAKLRDTLSSIVPILQNLNFGSIIKDEDYQKLIKYNSAWKDFFIMQADGSYKFIGDQEDMLKATREAIQEEKKELDNRAKLANNLNKAGWHNTVSGEAIDFTSVDDMKRYNLSTFLGSSSFGDIVEAMGYTTDQIQKWSDSGNTEALNQFYEKFAEFTSQDYGELSEQIDERFASMTTNLEELNAIQDEISQKAYDKQFKALSTEALNSADSIDEVKKVLEEYNLDESVAADKIRELGLTAVDQAKSFDELNEILKEYGLKPEDIAKKEHELALEAANDAETLDELIELRKTYGLTTEEVGEKIASFADNLLVLNRLREQELINEEQYNARAKEIIQTRFEEADSIQALDNILSELHQTAVDIKDQDILTFNEYSEALIRLGEACDNASTETYQYREALEDVMRAQEKASELSQRLQEYYEDEYSSEGEALEVARQLAKAEKDLAESKEKLAEAEDYLRAAVKASEGASKYGFDAKVIENQAKEIRQLNRDIELSAEEAVELAIANQRLNRGIKTLNENFEDWRKTLEESNPESVDYAEALTNVESAIADLIGAADDFDLPPDFLEMPRVLDLIDQAAEGDAQAINELGIACAQAQIDVLELDKSFAEFFNISETEFNTYIQDVLSGITDITNNLPALLDGTMSIQDAIGMGAESWIESLNQMALATGMSVEQMNGLLNELGVQAKVDVVSVPQSMEVPTYTDKVTALTYRSMPVTYVDREGNEHHAYESVPEYTRATVPGEPVPVDGYVQVAQIGTVEGKTPAASINFTGVGGTSVKRGTSTPRGGGVSKSSTAPRAEKKKSGGSKKETKEHKNLVDEKERYHVINQQIERQNNLLERLSKNKDRAFGPNKQKYYAQELKSLKDMGKMYEEHLRQSSAYLAQDKAVMQAWGAKISAKDGTILNYDALLKAQVDAYNRAVDRYNASSQTDADKDALKAAEDRFKKFQDDLKQYEDTVKTHEEDINKYIDNMIEQYDTMQAKTADAIEFRIEYDDSVLDFLDKLIDRLDSWNGSMFAAVDIMGKLNDKTGALIEKNKDLETATAETLEHFLMDYKEFDAQGNIIYQTGMSKADSDAFINRFNTGGLTSEDIEMLAHMPEEERQLLMDYAEQRQDNTDALIETAQAVIDDVERQFNDAKDELAEAAKPIASATAALDNYAAIIDIVGADYLGVTDDIMQRFRDQQWNVLHETTMSNKAIMESLAAQRDMIEQEMNNALANGNDELAEMYREKLKGINDEVQSATEAWYSSWQAELSKLEEDFEKHIDEIKTKALDLAAGDAGTWQSLKDTMDYAQQAAERFLPEYKEIYEFSKLNRDINKSIDDTDNIKNKQALKKLQEEINKLQERSGEISQYDLDNARRKYELELARLALEESRNAKEVVRLSKDSEGNWSYIYTASEEDVANAEQNYEDKLFAMQQANAEYINDLQGQLTQATEDYYNKVAEINLIYKDDDEKRREELEKARMQYEETMQYYGGELQKAMDNNKQLYDEDWAWYSDYTQKINDDQGYRLGELENYVTEFDDTMLGMATGYDSVAAFEDDLLDHSIDTLGQMDEAYEHWSEQIHFSMEEAGTSVEDFAEDMMEQVDHTIVPKAEEARDSVEDLGETVVDIMGEMVDAASQWRVSYSAAMDAIIAKNDAVKRSIQQVISALSALKTAEIGHDTTTGKAPEGAGKAGPTTSSPTKTSTTPSTGIGSTPGTGTSGSTTPTTKTTKTTPHVVETGYRYQNDETCMGYTKYSDGTETHNAGGHDKKFDHWEDNDAKYICTKCKHMWTVKNARGRGGCFAAGTKIMLPTRELKNIEEVQLGEEILAYNIETESFENKVVNMIYFKRGYNEMADIELSNGEILTMTLGHPLLTTQGWKSLDLNNSEFEHGVSDATLLSVGDILIGYDKPIIVNNINIYPVDKDYIVYCLGVDGYHNFIANDIIVHNAAYVQFTKFATGGYTGDFGNPNEGKLAVLHSKELVLNKDDTEHILNAVDMVRSISKTIDAYAMTNQFTIGNLTAARGVNPINGQMEQSVTITAEFPNATDRNEIAEAFNTLINQASQYANRKY